MPNHLANETSPYLLQHSHNPVNWFPWSEEALQKARNEGKPIFLSIGYSACHWCHVMAHESFEDERIAEILNKYFVSVKVDREERPDLDQIYMAAVQAMTGSGGWPMSVFLTPDSHPFYGGTYFPPAPRYSMPSFGQVLHAIVDAWQNRKQEIISGSQRIGAAIEQQTAGGDKGAVDLRWDTLATAVENLRRSFDQVHGGWGDAPKFPQPMTLEFLLRYHYRTGAAPALMMVTQTLEAMARGGLYDQVGGGFHRYSVDSRWLTPHFERMLYDNAQLARVYLHAWQVTGESFFRTITEEILDYVAREMTDPAGSFYSTQDADSEGEEGKFFLWTPADIRDQLSGEAEVFMQAYGITPQGNFEGKNILTFVGELGQRPALAQARRKLFETRQQRVHPGCDQKALTSWNGLMLAAFAEAARVLDRADYREVAEHNAEFLLNNLRQTDGRLLHSWKEGLAKLNGYLEDYSYLIGGLLELYQGTFDARWYLAAHELAEIMIAHFQALDGGFYDTSDDHETLIIRPRNLQDNATPSGNAMAATALLKLAGLANEQRYVDLARKALAQMQPMMSQYPLGFSQWLQALSYALAHPMEIAIVGNPEATNAKKLLAVAQGGFRPFQVVASGTPHPRGVTVPLLQDRGLVNGQASAYVCVNFTCRAPVTDPEALLALLSDGLIKGVSITDGNMS